MSTEKKFNKLIVVLSVAIPLVVAILFRVKIDLVLPVFLPPIYATINAITSVLLILAVVFVKKGNISIHEKLMKLAIFCSLIFLVLYVLYHMTSDSTEYLGEGFLRYVYFFILISHIVLSIAVIPFVLITYMRGVTNQVALHKKIAKYTFPLWLYVTVTGVLVYFMISPYYVIALP